MSEISITRFQPAAVSQDKATSVQAVDDLAGAKNTDSSSGQRGSEQGHESSPKHRPSSDEQNADSQHGAAVNASATRPGELEQAVSKLNKYVQTVKRDIYFDLDPLSQEPSVTVVDRESRQVVRQFDSKEALELARKVDTDEPISLFKTQV